MKELSRRLICTEIGRNSLLSQRGDMSAEAARGTDYAPVSTARES